jgi:hypothetical protein
MSQHFVQVRFVSTVFLLDFPFERALECSLES